MAVKRTAQGQRKTSPRRAVKPRARVPRTLTSKLQTQVKRLMRMRQEKKYAEISGNGFVGQVYDNSTGTAVVAITPSIPQGDGEGQRIGNSINATGLIVKQQFIKSPGAINNRRVRSHVVRVLDPSITDPRNIVLDVNPISGVRDYFSELNYTMMADKRVQILGTVEASMATDTPRDNTDPMVQREMSSTDLKIPVKFDDQVIRYEADGDTSPAAIRYFVITTCDLGNIGTSASTSPVFVTSTGTGVAHKTYARLWYTDS
jgi:hypothetical protein